jgi:hypothetical protein
MIAKVFYLKTKEPFNLRKYLLPNHISWVSMCRFMVNRQDIIPEKKTAPYLRKLGI